MFSKLVTSIFSSLQNKRMIKQNYYSSKEIIRTKQIPYPYCIDCRFYIPMEHSPLFPNSACKYLPKLKPCTTMRSKNDLCGIEGKHYYPRFNAYEYTKERVK
jgi:hypothetical protein